MLIETHAHLDYPEFAENLDDVIARAGDAGVEQIITIGTGLESSRRAVELAEKYSQVYAVVGIHPTNLDDDLDLTSTISALRELAANPRVAAIGETGLDYHRLPGGKIRKGDVDVSEALGASSSAEIHADIIDDAYQSRQAEFFHAQLELAAELNLNVVVHQRDAWDDTIEILKPFNGKLRGVFHCFVNELNQAQELIADGHLVSLTGIVTFKNAKSVQEVAAALPIDQFMVETDCPYLAPEPYRGKTAEPAHTRLVAEKIAELRGITLDEVAAATTATARNFFRLSG